MSTTTTSDLKPLVLYGFRGPAPNPKKVAIILEELGLPWTLTLVERSAVKAEPYISLNPNGRVPSLEDPNTGVKIFESGAIIDYLMEYYDKEFRFHSKDLATHWQQKSWLHFQVSGQGPYFGQKVWFDHFHAEDVPSAKERYRNEVKRVTGVLDAHLKKHGTPYLTGDTASYADLAFIPWQSAYSTMLIPEWTDMEEEVPFFVAWSKKLLERSAVQKALARPEFKA